MWAEGKTEHHEEWNEISALNPHHNLLGVEGPRKREHHEDSQKTQDAYSAEEQALSPRKREAVVIGAHDGRKPCEHKRVDHVTGGHELALKPAQRPAHGCGDIEIPVCNERLGKQLYGVQRMEQQVAKCIEYPRLSAAIVKGGGDIRGGRSA